MIVSLKGILVNKNPSEAIIDVNGVGYLCFISNNTYDSLPLKGVEVSLLIYHQISENSQNLYGFSDEVEKDMFLMLISVSGIGPKTGINLLSSVSPSEFKRRLVAGEVELLSALPGIGPKTARRIIVELKDKLVSYSDNSMPIENSENSESYQDAYDALKSLGFNINEINKCLSTLAESNSDFNTQDLIKEALKVLKK
ncbi:MAG: Holliday junction branch migration protein RuvA [Candidatus Marinimicrobia bacterium]|nr:Holliday junction branch migration protein RuvA [Candidatus Neomarinimicrobiota bacterium]